MELRDQIAIAVKAEAQRAGATRGTCAAMYAVAIGLASSAGAEYWRPINSALEHQFGAAGRDSIKSLAWRIHDHAANALAEAMPAAAST